MQVNVNAQPKSEPRFPWQQSRRQIERDSIDVCPAKLAETIISQTLEGERCQKVFAKLPVAGPWRTVALDLERQRIDEDRPPRAELKIVNAAVLEGHPAQDCPTLEFEGEQCGILELAEAPFVRVRNEFDPFGSNHLVGKRRVQRFGFDLCVLDQQPLVRQLAIQAGGQEMVIMRAVDLVDLTTKITVLAINKPRGVAERDCGERLAHHAFLCRVNSPSRNCRIQVFTKKAELSMLASKTWSTMLPAPGSRYDQTSGIDASEDINAVEVATAIMFLDSITKKPRAHPHDAIRKGAVAKRTTLGRHDCDYFAPPSPFDPLTYESQS